MSEDDAKALNEKDKRWEARYEAGDKTSRFNSHKELLDFAIANWKKYFPDGEVLIVGDDNDPNDVIAGDDQEVVDRLNRLVEKAEAIDYYEGGQFDRMCKISDLWSKILGE
jgi:alkanesulfonate monooxygenase SsuD/methylene tetrahydromethanopterin reductase-like flavin-dependent oxidoreductase (luciferase family)